MASDAAAIDRRQLLFGALLVGAAAAAAALRPRRTVAVLEGKRLEGAIPDRVGPYLYVSSTGLIVPDESEASERLYDDVLTRIYIADGLPPMMLLIAYGSAQDASMALHRPEGCYPSAGFEVGPATPVPLAGLPGETPRATVLTAARGDRVEQVYFWTRIGEYFPVSPLEEKLDVLRNNLRGVLPDGVLVRLSVRSSDRAAALQQMLAFNRMLIEGLGRTGRALLLGSAAA